MKLSFDNSFRSFPIDLVPRDAGKSYRATIEDRTIEVEVVRADREAPSQRENGKLDLLIDGKRVTAYVSSENAKRWVTINGQTIVLTKSSGARRSGHGHQHAAGELTAPMPGQVRAVNVSEGDAVTKGQTLLVLEAMKMEIRVQAPFDGQVSSISVKAGQTVEREQILIEIEEN